MTSSRSRQLTGDNTLGAVATPAGLHDPFAKPHTSQAAVAPATQKPMTASPLPGTIIVGTPGANKVTVQGWIVILASIPTAQGAVAANSFAAQARKAGVGAVSVLNSSNRKPLRGGYWVVYTGPYNTLARGQHRGGHDSQFRVQDGVHPAARHVQGEAHAREAQSDEEDDQEVGDRHG